MLAQIVAGHVRGGLIELLLHVARQRLAGLEVAAEAAREAPVGRPELEKVRRDVHRVPLQVGEAGHLAVGRLGEQVLEGVARLGEQRAHLLQRQERRDAVQRG